LKSVQIISNQDTKSPDKISNSMWVNTYVTGM